MLIINDSTKKKSQFLTKLSRKKTLSKQLLKTNKKNSIVEGDKKNDTIQLSFQSEIKIEFIQLYL